MVSGLRAKGGEGGGGGLYVGVGGAGEGKGGRCWVCECREGRWKMVRRGGGVWGGEGEGGVLSTLKRRAC